MKLMGRKKLMKLMDRKKLNKTFFYQRFVNEDKIQQINDFSIRRKYWDYTLGMSMFCAPCATFPTFVGYNFENTFAITIFFCDMFMYFLLFSFSIKFVKLDRQYGVFKSKKFLYLVPLIYILLSITFSIVAIFTTHFTSYPDTSFLVHVNSMFYFTIFIPLLLTYMMFCYYAFMKCFAKYARGGRNMTNNIEE